MHLARAHSQGRSRCVHEFLHGHVRLAGSQLVRQHDVGHVGHQLLLLLAHGRTRHVDGHVAATDHNYPLAHFKAVSQIHIQKKIDSFNYTVQVISWKIQLAAPVQPERHQHRFETLTLQVSERKIPTQSDVQLQLGT